MVEVTVKRGRGVTRSKGVARRIIYSHTKEERGHGVSRRRGVARRFFIFIRGKRGHGVTRRRGAARRNIYTFLCVTPLLRVTPRPLLFFELCVDDSSYTLIK